MCIKAAKYTVSAVCAAFILLTSCGSYSSDSNTPNDVPEPAQIVADAEDGGSDLFDIWTGEEITQEYAYANGGLFIGDTRAYNEQRFDSFSYHISQSEKTELTVCRADSVMKITAACENGEYKAVLEIKTCSDGVVSEKSHTISPVQIWCSESDDTLNYYICDYLIYSRPVKESGEYISTPAEFDIYSIKADANITLPYQKTFSSYSDFESYYDKYDQQLGLDSIKKTLSDYDSDGGFNTHVIFLYADMAGSEDISYEFIDAIQNNGKLCIYLKKNVPAERNSTVAKWQFTCTVPGEYLSDVQPGSISWVVYTDIEN